MKKLLIKSLLNLHSFTYRLISRLSIENGVHPKHILIPYHKFFIDNIPPNSTILDVGCGRGILTKELAKKSDRFVIGIDKNSDSLQFARRNNNHKRVLYITKDATSFLPNVYYNVIVLSNILEHIEDRISFLKYYGSISDRILIRVPMINRDWITCYRKKLGLDYRLDNSHYIEYTIPKLISELSRANLKLISFSIQFGEIWGIVKR